MTTYNLCCVKTTHCACSSVIGMLVRDIIANVNIVISEDTIYPLHNYNLFVAT